MPSRGFYEVANVEEGKAAQRDQSYRSCVMTLIIFFFLCIILIVAGCLFKKSHGNDYNEYNNDSMVSDGYGGNRVGSNDHRSNETTGTEEEEYTDVGVELGSEAEPDAQNPRNDTDNQYEQIINYPSTNQPETQTSFTNETGGLIFNEIIVPKPNETDSEATEKSPMSMDESTIFTSSIIDTTEKVQTTVSSNHDEESAKFEESVASGVSNDSTGDTRNAYETTLNTLNTEVTSSSYTEETTKSALIETSNEINTPTSENAITDANETSFVTTDSPTKIINNDVTTTSDFDNATTTLITEGFEPNSLDKLSNETNDDIQKPYETTIDTLNTEATSSSNTEEAYDSDVTKTFNEIGTSTTEKTFTEVTETSSVTTDIPTTLINNYVTPASGIGNESTTSIDESSEPSSLDKLSNETSGDTQEPYQTTEILSVTTDSSTTLINDDVTSSPNINHEETSKSALNETFTEIRLSTTEKAITEATETSLMTTDLSTSLINNYTETTPFSDLDNEFNDLPKEKVEVCKTGTCKQIASRMLSYMNHAIDACHDFYEYACGGLEADYQINEKNLLLRAYETIERQAKKNKNHPESDQFNKYYDSCIKYEVKFDMKQRIRLAKEALEKVGNFYTIADRPETFQGDFTKLFTNVLLNDRPLLFDVMPDVNEINPDTFTLKIGPVVEKKLFQFENEIDICDSEEAESRQTVDLDQLYDNYTDCKKNTHSFLDSVEQALKKLVFDGLDETHDISQSINETVFDIDVHILKQILSGIYPHESKIREAYRYKSYTTTTLSKLQNDCNLINWSQLIESLTGLALGPNETLQVYYEDELVKAMQHLKKIDPLKLNNALLGLYARNLYQDLVAWRSSTNLHKHCFSMAIHLMESEASGLYMSSFTEKEIIKMTTLMEGIFKDLKETLEEGIRSSNWTSERGRKAIIDKLSAINMSLPSFVKNKEAYEVHITENYFENSMNLMKKYRSMRYSVIRDKLRPIDQIWTFFASPFESTARTIYGLNLIVIPFGTIDWPTVLETDEVIDYLTQATIGNLIAREIAHDFDTNGIHYWNRSRGPDFAPLVYDDETRTSYDDYTDCHRYSRFHETEKISLPMSGQDVFFTAPPMSLNERLSDTVGLRLVTDTLARLGYADTKKALPWINLNVKQLFYLAYAQTHCTKAPLTSSYVSLHEDPILPSRIRVYAVLSNNKFIDDAWKCLKSSKTTTHESNHCDEFPHLKKSDVIVELEAA